MKRAALFVGVNNYCDKGINNLSCAVNDATATARFFGEKGFETHLMTDSEVSLLKVRNKISEICSTLKSGDVFVFYFSGHGHETADNHYLLCPEASTQTLDIDGGGDAIPLAVVRRFSENCCDPGVHRLFILDCCRNNVRAGAKDVFKAASGKGIELVALDNEDGILPPWILRSCQNGQRSFEDETRGHGYFTLALGETLEESQIKTFSAFFDMLKRKMQHFIHPSEQRITLGEYSGGSFPLFEEWENAASEGSVSESTAAAQASAPKVQVAADTPLAAEERSGFYAFLEEVKYLYMKEIAPCDFSERFREELSKIRRSLEKLQAEEPSRNGLRELKELKASLEAFQKLNQQKKQCAELSKKVDLELKSLKEAQLPPGSGYLPLRSGAMDAQSKGDWEAALQLWQRLLETLADEKSKVPPDFFEGLRELKAAQEQSINFSSDNKVITFCPRKDITELHIPRSVTTIDRAAFRGCTHLQSLTIPSGVTSIGESAFEGCSGLVTLQLPSGKICVGPGAFAHCRNLKEVVFEGDPADLSAPEWKKIFEGCRNLRIPTPAAAPVPEEQKSALPVEAPLSEEQKSALSVEAPLSEEQKAATQMADAPVVEAGKVITVKRFIAGVLIVLVLAAILGVVLALLD